MTPSKHGSTTQELVFPNDKRADGLPMLPGGNKQQLTVLRSLLQQLGHGRKLTSELAWPTEQHRTTVRAAVRRLSRTGLVRREGDRAVLTAAALAWCTENDDVLLIETFHRHVAFIGELMAALNEADGPVSLDELLALGRTEYGLPWKTVTPVRQRTNWLRVTGMIDYFGGGARLTERGREVTPRLALPRPRAALPTEGVKWSPQSIEVAALLEQLSAAGGRMRGTGANLYIPGHQENSGRLQALRTLVEGALPSVDRDGFAGLCAQIVGRAVPLTTATTVLETATALGLLHRKAKNAWHPTPAAQAWLDTDDRLDLAAIIHTHIVFFGELLSHLIDGTAHTAGELSQLSKAYLGGAQLRVPSINARLQLLTACGLVEKRTATTYQAMPESVVFVAALPLASAITCDEERPIVAEANGVVHAIALTAQELESAARDSQHSERLECAVIAGLEVLGLPGRHIGGNGHADGAVHIGLGTRRRTIAVEAKTAGSGAVPPERVDFEGLTEHRDELDATVTLLVGPQFHDRVHKSARKDQTVAVLHSGFLAELVRGQEVTPLAEDQLDMLVDPHLDARQREEAISSRQQEQLRRIEVERVVVETLLEEAENSPEGGWMTLRELERYLRRQGLPECRELISQSLDLLAHPRIAAVEFRQSEFRLVVNRQTIGRRMRALGCSW